MINSFMVLNLNRVDALKKLAIKKYDDFLRQVKKGYKPDYCDILNIICFISLPGRFTNHEFIKSVIEIFINDKKFITSIVDELTTDYLVNLKKMNEAELKKYRNKKK